MLTCFDTSQEDWICELQGQCRLVYSFHEEAQFCTKKKNIAQRLTKELDDKIT